MDEPLSNLDAKLRVQMRADIAALQADFGITTVYVTHDQAEAMTLGHRVAVAEGREAAAVRPAAGAVRAAGERVRRRLHRLADDEPLHASRWRERLGRPRRRDVSRCPRAPRREGGSSSSASARVARARRARGSPRSRGRRGRRRRRASCSASRRSGTRRSELVARTDTRNAPRQGERVALQPRPAEAHVFDAVTGERLEPPMTRSRAGRELPRRDPRAAGRARAPARAPGRVRAVPPACVERAPVARAARGPWLLGRGGRLRRLRLRPPARLDGHARLDLADRLLRRAARLLALGRRRPLAVGEHAGRRLVCRAGARARRAHGRRDERAGLGARLGGRGDAAPRGWRRALGRRDEDVLRTSSARSCCSRASQPAAGTRWSRG